jgi:hypothetical protein
MANHLVTTRLAKENFLPAREVFGWFKELGWMEKRKGAAWSLTPLGVKVGGAVLDTEHGSVPAWPETVLERPEFLAKAWKWSKKHLVDAKDMAKSLGGGIESWEINAVLSEMGWIGSAGNQGWMPTEAGYENGGAFCRKPEYPDSPHVRWPNAILKNEEFLSHVTPHRRENRLPVIVKAAGKDPSGKKPSGETRFRTDDGHLVRSKAEVLIDNWLYAHGLAHAYEPPLPGGKFLGDFLVPTKEGGIYIEFWGLAGNPAYDRKLTTKRQIYQNSKLRLMELLETDMTSLDDALKSKFSVFGLHLY